MRMSSEASEPSERRDGRPAPPGSPAPSPVPGSGPGRAEAPGPAEDAVAGPLAGVTVLELGQLLAGPFCGQLLGDFGAEVIKCEDPGKGDPMREWGREKPHGLSLWWPVVARGKKSVTLNLRSPKGQELFRDLVRRADVVVENFRPGTLERWGFGFDALSALNERLVLTRVTGFGQDGPYASRAGYGAIGEAMGGLRYVCGDPSTPPSRMGISIGDALAGTFAAYGTVLALFARERTGRGQVVDSAIYEAVLAMMESLVPEYALGRYIRERTGATLPNVAPSNVYPTADGALVLIAANQDSVFARLAAAMGEPELATDPRYASHSARGLVQVELDERIAAWTRGLPAAELEAILDEHAVPQGRIFTAADMLADPHFAARRAIVELPHPELGPFPMQNVAPRLSATPGSIRWVGPALGAHNDEIWGERLGLSGAEREALTEEGVL
jgi:formyl-CoA transferase